MSPKEETQKLLVRLISCSGNRSFDRWANIEILFFRFYVSLLLLHLTQKHLKFYRGLGKAIRKLFVHFSNLFF